MRIKSLIILSMTSAAALIGLVGGLAIFTQMAATRSLGLTEATNVARELADTIVFKPSDGTPSLFERPEALKQFMEHQHRRMRRDFLVLDRNKTVVAHAADEEQSAKNSNTIPVTKSARRWRTASRASLSTRGK